MRALRMATLLTVVLSLVGGASTVVAAATSDPAQPIRQVAGSLDVHPLPGGTFDVEDRVYQYRGFPVGGSAYHFSDPRLTGYLLSDWSWDVHASGEQPIPAWGTITISGDDGSWQGAFTGIRSSDFSPVDVRVLLIGDGAYEGLCATLDITTNGLADAGTWVVDGVVHPVAMAG